MATMFPIMMIAAIRDVQKHSLTGSDRRKRLVGALATANAPAAGIVIGQRQTRDALAARTDDLIVVEGKGNEGDNKQEQPGMPVEELLALLARVDSSNEKAQGLAQEFEQYIAQLRESLESGEQEVPAEWVKSIGELTDFGVELTKRTALTDRYTDDIIGKLSG